MSILLPKIGGVFQGGLRQIALILLIVLYGVFPVSLALSNILIALVLLFWLVGSGWRGRWSTLRSCPVVWALLALYGLMLLGVAYTDAPASDWKLHLSKYLKLPMVVVWISLLLASKRAQEWAIRAFAAAMFFILVSTWLNVWLQLPWSASQNQGWGVTHHVFGDYITQNVMMAFFVLLALVWAERSAVTRWRALWWSVAILSAISITHLSQGRTGYVLLAAILMVFVIARFRGWQVLAALAGVVVFCAGMLVTSETMMQRFVQAREEAVRHDVDRASSIGHRLYNYKTVPMLIAEAPWVGHGTGSYHTEICRVLDDPSECSAYNWHPHNQYLFFAAEHGLVGLLLFLLLLAALILVARRSSDPDVRILLVGLAVLLAVDGLFNSPLWSARENHFFTLMMALLISMAMHTRKEPSLGSSWASG